MATLSIRGTTIIFCHFANKETFNTTWHSPFKNYAMGQENTLNKTCHDGVLAFKQELTL